MLKILRALGLSLTLVGCGAPPSRVEPPLHAMLLGEGPNGRAVGSAFAADGDHLVTAAHVVAGVPVGTNVRVAYADSLTSATLVARSTTFDVALLRRPPDTMPSIEFRDAVTAGQAVTAHGTTVSAKEAFFRRATGSLTEPCVRLPNFGRGMIAALPGATPGFSGGPVVDRGGRLIGMLIALDQGGGLGDAFASNGRANSSAETKAFLLPSVIVRKEVEKLLGRHGTVQPSDAC